MKRSLRCRRAFLPMPIAHAHAHASPIALHNTRAAAVWIIEKFVLAVNSISVEYGRSVEIICMTFLAVGHPTFCCRRNGIQLTYMNGDIWHWRGERSCVCVCVWISVFVFDYCATHRTLWLKSKTIAVATLVYHIPMLVMHMHRLMFPYLLRCGHSKIQSDSWMLGLGWLFPHTHTHTDTQTD